MTFLSRFEDNVDAQNVGFWLVLLQKGSLIGSQFNPGHQCAAPRGTGPLLQ